MKNKNILELCLAHGLGGLEMFVTSCYEEFSKKTTCKVVVAPQTKLDNYLSIEDKFHIKRNKLFPIIPAFKLAKYIDENDIDIVHFHWTKDIVTAVLAKFLSKKKPKLVQSRHMRMTRFKDDFYHRWLYKNIFMIHGVTKQVTKQLEKFIPVDIRPKIELVYLGVEPKKGIDTSCLIEKYNIKNEFIVGIIGRIEAGKNQHIVIEALAQLKELDIKLFIIGDSMDEVYTAQLHQLCKEKKIEDEVVFTGFTKEVDLFMSFCDVTVLATNNETFGLVVIESMANKTPVIAVANGGPLEIIEDKEDGFLYDGTSKDLTRIVQLLYSDAFKIQKVSQKALEKIKKKFDKKTQLQKLYNLIEDIK